MDLLAEKQDLFKKKCEEKSLLRKKGFVMQKNRIYLRKKGDDKNRKKKDFFPPDINLLLSMMEVI